MTYDIIRFTYYELDDYVVEYLSEQTDTRVHSKYWVDSSDSRFINTNISILQVSVRAWTESNGIVELIKDRINASKVDVDMEEFLYVKLKARQVI